MEYDRIPKTDVNQIINTLLASGIKLFHDQYNDPYLSTDGKGGRVLPLRSRSFQEWLGHYTLKASGNVISPDALAKIVNTLIGKALFEGEEKYLQVRVCRQESAIWYDLGEKAVIIGDAGWSVFDSSPILFKRFQHQKNQVIPIESYNIDLLRIYINLRNNDDYLIFLVYLIASFIPGFPHPILILHGPQGSGKTTPMEVLKELIDPSQLHSLSAPKNQDDFVHIASKHYFFFFDNLSSMPSWFSDTLARACTGDGFSKRALYTNDDDVIYTFQSNIAINGINQIVNRSDLLDRSILIRLDRIADHKRTEYTEIWKAFHHDKPIILGSIFTILAKAMKLFPNIKLNTFPRMADFYRWGCAITEAMGVPKENFILIYKANVNSQHDEAIESSTVAQSVINFMENLDAWEGTATKLLNELNNHSSTQLSARNNGLPQHPNWLSRSLTLLQPDLLANGIVVQRLDTERPRKLRLTKNNNLTVDTDVLSQIEATEKHFGQVELLDFDDPFINGQHDDTDSKNLKSSEES